MTARKNHKRSFIKRNLKVLPYLFIFLAVLGVVNYGSKNKHVDEATNNLNLQSIAKKDYAVSTDQLSEFYVVSELASNMSLASSEVVNVNYNSLTTLRDSGQVSSEKMEKPIAPLSTNCLKVGAISYTVLEGETIASIAAKYAACGVTDTMVRWSNNFKNTYEPKAGDKIYLPSRAGFVYKIKNNDTIESVAAKYGSKSDEIIAANNLELNQNLVAGEYILLPDGNLPRPNARIMWPLVTPTLSLRATLNLFIIALIGPQQTRCHGAGVPGMPGSVVTNSVVVMCFQVASVTLTLGIMR